MSETTDFLDDWFDGDEDKAEKAEKELEAAADADEETEAEDDAEKDDKENQSDDDADEGDDAEAEQGDEPGDETEEADDPEDRTPTTREFKGMLDEREKRQRFEAENEDLRRRLAEYEQQGNAEETPDPLVDAAAFQQHQKQLLAEAEQRATMRSQEYAARVKYTDEVIDKAVAAIEQVFKKDPNDPEYVRVVSSKFPYDALVKWHNDQELLTEINEAGGKEAWLKAQREQTTGDDTEDDVEESSNKGAGGRKPPPSFAGKGTKGKKGTAKAETEEDVFKDMFSR